MKTGTTKAVKMNFQSYKGDDAGQEYHGHEKSCELQTNATRSG